MPTINQINFNGTVYDLPGGVSKVTKVSGGGMSVIKTASLNVSASLSSLLATNNALGYLCPTAADVSPGDLVLGTMVATSGTYICYIFQVQSTDSGEPVGVLLLHKVLGDSGNFSGTLTSKWIVI